MANDNIIKFTEYSEKVNKVLSTQIGILDSAATNLEALNTAYGKLPSEYFNAIKQGLEIEKKKVQVDKELITLEQKKADLIAKSARAEKAQIQTKQTAIRLSEQEAKANAKANQSLEQSVNTYTKIQLKIKQMIPVYNDLAAKQQIGIKLTAKEEAQLTLLTNRLTKYRGALNQVNKDYGNYSLEVGNYAQGTKNLQFSIAQISRELPNFGQSFQIGVLSLTNNIGFLLDGIKQVKAGNEILKAQGKATQSVFKTILGSFLSFQTLLFVGIGLFSAYSGEIGDFFTELFKGNQTIKQLNEESAKISSQSIPQFKALVKISQDVTESETKRADAIRELKELYPDFNAEILKEKENTNLVNKEIDTYISKIQKKAKAQAAMGLMQEKFNELILQEQKTEESRLKLKEQEGRQLNTQINAYSAIALRGADRQTAERNLNKELEAQAKIQDEINKLEEIYIKNVDLSIKKDDKKNDKKNRDKVKSVIDIGFESINPEDFKKYAKKVIELLENTFNVEAGKIDFIKLPPIDVKDFELGLTQLQILTDDFVKDLGFKSIEDSPLSSLKTFFDGTFENLMLGANTTAEEFAVAFNTIGEVAKQTFAMMSQLGQQNLEQELEMLDKRYETQLLYAGDGEAAKAELEEKYEARRKAIQTKQAKAQKAQAIFSAGITSGQAALAAYASQLIPGDPTSIVRAQIAAGIAAAFGLLQIGFISSQKIPEFKDGVRNFEGGAAIVGDGGVSEIVRTKNGVYATPNKDTLVNLPKGADVFKNHEEYYNSVMGDMGVLPSIPKINVVNNGITKVDLDQVMSKHFSNIQINELNLNKGELKLFVKKQNSITSSLNNRVSFKGFSV